MKPIGYYCNTTDSITMLVKQFGEHLEGLNQVEKIDLLYHLVETLWNLNEPWKTNTQKSEDAFRLIKGQSQQSLIELCTAIITYIQEGDRQARASAIAVNDINFAQLSNQGQTACFLWMLTQLSTMQMMGRYAPMVEELVRSTGGDAA